MNRAGISGLAAAVSILAACAPLPTSRELGEDNPFAAEVRVLASRQALVPEPGRARFEPDAWPAWSTLHLPATLELFAQESYKERYYISNRYVHDRPLDWQCRESVSVPSKVYRDWARRYEDKDFLQYGRGDCYELSSKKHGMTAYLAVFNLPAERPQGLNRPAWLTDKTPVEQALTYEWGYNNFSLKRTAEHYWRAGELEILEMAGRIYDSFSFIHAPLYELDKGRYYRFLIVGRRTVVLCSIYGANSHSIDSLRAAGLEILRALR